MTHFDKITTKLLLFLFFVRLLAGAFVGVDAWTAAWTVWLPVPPLLLQTQLTRSEAEPSASHSELKTVVLHTL